MEPSSTNWELDSDEIASIASEDLHQHRPNRWTGAKSSWRTITEEDRLVWRSMKQLQDRDLAVHLYNTFALKRRGRDAATAADLMVQTDDGQQVVWAPPKAWTAWPLKHKQVHNDRLINSQHDEDERFTFRRPELPLPSTELEEELSATILQTAKRRFRRRKSKMAPRASIESVATPGEGGSDSPGPSSREASAKPETEDEDEDRVAPGMSGTPPATRRRRLGPKTYEPVVSANDDFSYELLRPSVRHILTQLDTTLSILHSSRVTSLSYLSDSSAEDESDSQSSQKRPRGRPRTETQGAPHTTSPDVNPVTTPSRRGRPRKVHLPREDESHEEMLLRIARESHRRLPTTPKDQDAAFEEWMRQDQDAAFDEWIREGDETIERERSLSLKREASESLETENGDKDGGKSPNGKLARWGLRDWSDVLGAAALAGFSSEAIARTTQRCANLFGEGMLMRKLNEAPVSHGSGFETVEYRPEPIQLSRSLSDVDDTSGEDEDDLAQRRVASRQASLARSSHDRSSPESFRGRRSRSRTPQSPATPRSRSRSGSAAGLFYCPIPSCDRAAQGFTRKPNLRRHLELIHQGQTEEMDSDDEVAGAVHVDGFLRPIVPGRGWRGEDATMRKRKRYYGRKATAGSRAGSSELGGSSS
ncbi:hypothetical protein AK830_g9792 [Neonectria ditissima]|uniref:C2H2-type domain-containing protein n=1 Tax=Neonectria ditissima TaxID=78410 RepID=A0A0P7ARC5_9HYPO|nr:hypothetical protein AK830_g9792 [Neonectria ditissima]